MILFNDIIPDFNCVELRLKLSCPENAILRQLLLKGDMHLPDLLFQNVIAFIISLLDLYQPVVHINFDLGLSVNVDYKRVFQLLPENVVQHIGIPFQYNLFTLPPRNCE
jgi:hypothetical protein